jgi:hypothetical protein
MRRVFAVIIGALLLCSVAGAQQLQTGSIEGTVTLSTGEALPGVAVTATTDVLPKARATVTDSAGRYRFVSMPPGDYELTFEMAGFATEKRQFPVYLQQKSIINVQMRAAQFEDEIIVTAETPTIDTTSAELRSAITDEIIEGLPVGQQYRDLVKLVPGVMYTEDEIRGPSAGGSGQDNIYQFDGASVTLPLYGTLSSQPSSNDIEEVAVVRGGANAVGFNRSGGFLINTISKSGTNQFRGQIDYQIQTDSMTSDVTSELEETYDPSYDWLSANFGGPIIPEMLYFFVSYYRPTEDRQNRANVYGEVPDYNKTRDEYFGKLTFTPTDSLLFHASYRDSETDASGAGVGEYTSAENSNGNDATLKIGVFEGSWVVTDKSLLTFKYASFENKTSSTPDWELGIDVGPGMSLDVDNLDQMGQLAVPTYVDGEDDYNAFITPIIAEYGYLEDGVPTGGGTVGPYYYYDFDDFYNTSFQLGYDHYLGNHELHIGYKWEEGEEELVRYSNGWGRVYVRGGREAYDMEDGTPVFYEARVYQASWGQTGVEPLNGIIESQVIELNDVWRMGNWTFNLGLTFSNDKMYGEGLRPNSSNPSGWELDPGNKYLMKEIKFDETISPRLAATWSPNGKDALYASWARYYPGVSSLPRAASWDRNLTIRDIYAQFDADGNFLGIDPARSSSGKLFQEGIDPRSVDEYVIGYDKQISNAWTGRVHVRHRQARDFWEDTNNDTRVELNPPEGVPREYYIPGLGTYEELGLSDSSYVIAQLDGAFTRYYEVSTEAEWRSTNVFLRASYVWSHYYGNFDQDNMEAANDFATYYGSSYIADGAGRQVWDYRYGNLRGDRRHKLKVYGFYNLPWNGTVGAYGIYQSGEPWEFHSVEPYLSDPAYIDYTTSRSSYHRFGEPAGSNLTDSHYQLDLSYTQNFPFGNRFNILLRGEVFNVTDNQTGHAVQPRVDRSGFGEPTRFIRPRRFQLTVAFQF